MKVRGFLAGLLPFDGFADEANLRAGTSSTDAATSEASVWAEPFRDFGKRLG
jgi:hypothetical protein